MKKLKVVDLFCGAGGLSYGFTKMPNFEIIAANDILPDMCEAYGLNHPGVKVYCDDIKFLSAQRIYRDLGLGQGDIDIVIGGPPCQAYSTVGKRALGDPRGVLFREYNRLITELQPKLFIFENVRGLVSMQKGVLFKEILELFRSEGYTVNYRILNAAKYGAPQVRERVIIVGHRLDKDFSWPPPTHTASPSLFEKPFVTLGQALGDLPLIQSGESSDKYTSTPQTEYQTLMRDTPTLHDHNAPKNNPRLVALMESLAEGGSPKHAPAHLKPSSGFGNSYSRLWWNKPSSTITRNFGTPSSARCIHPKVARALTTREGARLQGFPDSYIFVGSRTAKNLQIGNAVPTQLSSAIAQVVAQFLVTPPSTNASPQGIPTLLSRTK